MIELVGGELVGGELVGAQRRETFVSIRSDIGPFDAETRARTAPDAPAEGLRLAFGEAVRVRVLT